MTNYYPLKEISVRHKSQPTVSNQNIPIQLQSVPNQTEIDNLRYALGSKTSFVTCPYCRNQGSTRTIENYNVADVIFCVITLGTLWGIVHLLRGKDTNCDNTEHFCKKCNVSLGEYIAC